MIKLILLISTFLRFYQQKNFECTNGLDPRKIGLKQTLIEFSKSTCSPLILIPGIESTKLVIEIDCPVFRKENPEWFKACGWNDC